MFFFKEKASFFFQAEDGIRDIVRSRGLGDVYKQQMQDLDTNQSITRLEDSLAELTRLTLVLRPNPPLELSFPLSSVPYT